jgi:hypothetical protein
VNINEILMKLPLASSVFLAYAVVGAIMLLSGSIEYGAFSTNLLAIGIACGAIGAPRAVSKLAEGTTSVNLLGIIEKLPIPSLVFIVFLIASSISMATGVVSFGEFSENVGKVGIACGVIQATRAVEHVFEPNTIKPAPPATPAVSG